jgi:hypothetical protein
MSGRKRREVKKNGKAEEEDVQERKAAKKTKTSSSESFTIRGSWEGISDAPIMGMKKAVERVVKGAGWWSRKENKRNGRYNMGTDGE